MSVASRRATSISRDDFFRMFRQCVPPTGFPHKIGVANSGGPDSTCLLFLIHRYFSQERQEVVPDRPSSVISLTIDHDLQSSSSAMAEHCSKVAQALDVEHLTFKIPWSDPPFPPCPSPGQAFENTARDARYHGLFQSMTQTNTDVIAFGQHSDDQIETSLMRLGRGTTELGAGGMKPCRRWGMGMGKGEGSLGWAGYNGMSRWIVRPLLGVSKDRILATCDANNLEYVTDTTNFQPAITLRNALRQAIEGNLTEPVPANIAEKLSAIDKALSSDELLSVNLGSGVEQLRSAISLKTDQVADIDVKVDSALRRCILPSPTGTILFSSNGIARIHDDLTRRAMVLRALRYVSFHPWGSIRADANRRRTSLNQIITKIWHPNPFGSKIRMFVAGGGVLWTPVAILDGRIKTPDRIYMVGTRTVETFGWLGSRQPPLSWENRAVRGIANSLRVDVTQQLVKALKEWGNGAPPVVQVLYDCRFVVHFNMENVPGDLSKRLASNEEKIMIHSNTRWFWPKVVGESTETATVLHSEIHDSLPKPDAVKPNSSNDHTKYWGPKEEAISSEWIKIEWIRSLSAL